MPNSIRKTPWLLMGLILLISTLAAYEPLRHNAFVDYDDEDYITKNPHVLNGLTREGLVWAFTETDLTANWHPLTWLSHMLDVELFGPDPFWHHSMNLLLHIANTLLLLWVFTVMTGSPWAGFFVAALFALHPLHVESVAWASERKDVLSGLFWILTIAAYRYYAVRPSVLRYGVVLLSFALGLMAKPMLVTLPFVLLLLDYWPLGRLDPALPSRIRTAGKLLAEKVPLLLLSAGACAITYLVQHQAGAMLRGESYTLSTRLANAAVAYVSYLGKLFYPVKLAVLYPHPGTTLPLWKPIAALAVLILITAIVLVLLVKKPYLFAGWFWYLGTLVPVIGLVQVGSQAIADRYTYLPTIGIFIMIAWTAADLAAGRKYRSWILGIAGGLLLTACLIGTRIQTAYWKDTLTLYKHTLEVTENNYVIHNNYGSALQKHGDLAGAAEHLHQAIQIKPDYVGALNNLGMVLRDQGRPEEAIVQWKKALEIELFHPNVNANMGITLAMLGNTQEAIGYMNKALQANPNLPNAHCVLGIIYLAAGDLESAGENLSKAVTLQPDNLVALNNLAVVQMQQGRTGEAIKTLNRILELDPKSMRAILNLAQAYAQQGQHDQAIPYYLAALQIDPRQPEVLGQLADSYAKTGDIPRAIESIEKALPLLIGQDNKDLTDSLRRQLESYKKLRSSGPK